MHELTASDYETIAGGFPVVPAIGLGLQMINSSGAIYDFFSGFLDGFNNVH